MYTNFLWYGIFFKKCIKSKLKIGKIVQYNKTKMFFEIMYFIAALTFLHISEKNHNKRKLFKNVLF